MHNKHEGLILQYNKQQNTYTIFDNELGKISCPISSPKAIHYFNGLFIRYHFEIKKNRIKIIDAEMSYAPINIDAETLCFLHTVLEVCSFFLHEGQADTDLFNCIRAIFIHSSYVRESFYKKIILCKLFFMLGIIPEIIAQNNHLRMIMHLPIDSITTLEINLEGEKVLTAWIRESIQMHPQVGKFKTIRFFSF